MLARMRFAFRPAVPKPRPADRHVRLPAQLDDGPLGHLRGQRSAVPALAIFDLGEREGCTGTGQNHRGPVRVGRLGKRLINFARRDDVDAVLTDDRFG
jgi:hypothetical protein